MVLKASASRVKIALCILFSFLSSAVLSGNYQYVDAPAIVAASESKTFLNVNLQKIISVFSGNIILTTILFILCFLLFRQVIVKKPFILMKTPLVTAALFSAFLLIGQTYSKYGLWKAIIGNGFQMLLSLVFFAGYGLVFYAAIHLFFSWLDSDRPADVTYGNRLFTFAFDRHPFLFPFIFIFIAWLPYHIINFPGSNGWDAMYQLSCFTGDFNWTNQHPFVSTIIMGLFFTFGKLCGSANIGLFLYNIFQSLVCSAVFALAFCYFKKLNTPVWLRVFSLAFYAFYTAWPSYAQTFIKDTLFFGLFVLYLLLLLDAAIVRESAFFGRIRNVVFACAVITSLCLMRNNGIYVFILSFPFLFLCFKKYRLRMLCVIAVPVCAFLAVEKILLGALGIYPAGKQEMLSIPFQQTARYVKYYGDEVTEEERQAIDAVLDYESLAESYRPNLSDPVKDKYTWAYGKGKDEAEISKIPGENQALAAYFKIWFQQFLKHPGVYFQATLNGTYGYVYLQPVYVGYYDLTDTDTAIENEFSRPDRFVSARETLKLLPYLFMKIPLISILYSNGIYTWLAILVTAYILHRRAWKHLVVISPILVSVVICLASPLNGHTRYLLPVMAAAPIMLAIILHASRRPAHPASPPEADETAGDVTLTTENGGTL